MNPYDQTKDGFSNLPDNLDSSIGSELHTQPLGLLSDEAMKTKYKHKTIKIEMDQEQPVSVGITNALSRLFFSLGSAVINQVVDTGSKVPGALVNGVAGIYQNVAQRMANRQEQKANEKAQTIEEIPEIVFIVMPDTVINQGIQAQNQWMEDQREQLSSNIKILPPMQKNFMMRSPSDKKDPPSECEVDLVESNIVDKQGQGFFRGIDESESSVRLISQFLAISNTDYEKIKEQYENPEAPDRFSDNDLLVESVYQPTNTNPTITIQLPSIEGTFNKTITVYPFLPTIMNRDQVTQMVQREYEQLEKEELAKTTPQSEKPQPETQQQQEDKVIQQNPYGLLEQEPQFVPLPQQVVVKPVIQQRQVQYEQEEQYEYE